MVYRIANKLVRKCKCGGKPTLHLFVDHKEKFWFVCCYRMSCKRARNKFYKNPISAIIFWNFRDWNYERR